MSTGGTRSDSTVPIWTGCSISYAVILVPDVPRLVVVIVKPEQGVGDR